MLLHVSAAKFIHLLDKAVEEVAVVRNYDYCAVEILDSIFQYILGAHVEMIGGLIHDEQVDGLQ